MSEANTQTVVAETDVQPQAGTEIVTDARQDGDLDTLLKTYDEQVAPAATTSTPEPKPGAEPDLKAVAQEIQQLKGFVTEAQTDKYKRDMADTVKSIRGDLDPGMFDDNLVESYLDTLARQDPRLAKAWVDRSSNPKQFEQVKAALAKSFAKKFSKMPDAAATEDRAAVSAAVRGASTRTPESQPLKLAALSNSDAKKAVEDQFGYTPNY